MKLLIVVHHHFELWNAPQWLSERLRRDFPEIEVHQFRDYPEAEPYLADADAIVTWSLRPEQVRAAKKLRWIHSPAAAVHQLMIPEIVNSDIILTNASSVHGPVVAEHVVALMFALAKRIPNVVLYQQQHVWCKDQLWEERPRPREIAGATLGVIGVGSIGGEVARRALALGMDVIAMREHPERGADFMPGAATGHKMCVLGKRDLGSLLRKSDFVVVAAPLTETTRALINRQNIRCMKSDAYLINVARGPLVDEGALVQALREGQIAGAALDVFEQEPLPVESPLWDTPDLLITPHSAALTEKLWDRHYALISENVRRYATGEELLGLVDKTKGY
jgi:phosphoglycerate dehydrogenase-like enzyme